MRLLVSWKTWGDEVLYLFDELRKKHQIAYWIGEERHHVYIQKSSSETIFHVKNHATYGHDSLEAPTHYAIPPSKELIKSMLDAESIVLTMMNRKFGPLTTDQRKLAYYRMLGYWHSVLTKEKVDAVIFEDVPHVAYNYIIYALAQQLGIRTIMFQKVRIGDRFLLLTDWRKGSIALTQQMEVNRDKKISEEELEEDIREMYSVQVDGGAKSKPVYKNYRLDVDPPKRALFENERDGLRRNFLRGGFWYKVRMYLARKILPDYRKQLRREYEALSRVPDYSQPYIYVGLHYQPERTTCPQGDVYTNQLLMVQTLSMALPKGWHIYVKEHPMQWWAKNPKGTPYDRYRGYYKDMAALDNVEIVPIETNSLELVNHARAVSTVTGTIGLEALFRGKPVLVFGFPWYKEAEGVFLVQSVSEAKDAIQRIDDGCIVSQQSLPRLLKSLEEASISGFYEKPDRLPDGHPCKLSKREAQNNIIKSITSVLEGGSFDSSR